MLGRGNFVTNGDPDSYLTSRMLAGLFLIRMAFHTGTTSYDDKTWRAQYLDADNSVSAKKKISKGAALCLVFL